MELQNYVNKANIITGIDAQNWKEAIYILADVLHKNGYVRDSFGEAAIEREKVFPTGIENGGSNFALPHTDPEHVIKPGIAVGILNKPIPFKRMDDDNEYVEIPIMFMLAIKEPDEQISALRTLMLLLQDRSVFQDLLGSKTGGDVYEILCKKNKN